MKLLEATLASCPIPRPIPSEHARQGLCLDKGYDYQAIRDLAVQQRFVGHIRTRGEELQEKLRDPTWRARRWVVEACHSWMNRWRSILIRWSKKPENHDAMLHLAAGLIAMKKARQAALPG
jgi:putative transposase